MKSIYPFTLALVFSPSALMSQNSSESPQKFDATEAIAAVKKRYVAERQKLESDFERLFTQIQSGYLASLDKLQADTAKSGNLNAVQFIKEEKERVVSRRKASSIPIPAMPVPLKTLQEKNELVLKSLLENGMKVDSDLRTKCLSELDVLQKRVTKAGFIEQAVEVKREKERFAEGKSGETLNLFNVPNVLSDLVKRLEGKLILVPGTDILLSKTEFTVGEWKLYLQEAGLAEWKSPRAFAQTDEHPVGEVSWDQVKTFCDWLSAKTGKEWRLPTNKEWLAAVGGAIFPWGNYFPAKWDDGNYSALEDGTDDPKLIGVDGIFGTAPVGSFKPNRFGFYDLGGNVAEWILDRVNPTVDSPTALGGHCNLVGRQSNTYYTTSYSSTSSRAIRTPAWSGFRIAQGKFPGKLTAPPPLPATASQSPSTPPPAPVRPAPAPVTAQEVKLPSSSTVEEHWEPKLQRVEDHPVSGDSTLSEGWILKKPDAAPKNRNIGISMNTGAVRAEFRWPASGNSGSLSLLTEERGYFLERARSSLILRFENTEVGRFDAPMPKLNDTYKLELRMSGKFVLAFLDGKEVIQVDDDLRPENTSLPVTPAVTLQDAALRNIEVLIITPADAPKK